MTSEISKSDVVLPRINTNDNDVEIIQWFVQDSAFVEKGADLVEVTTSKAAVVLEAPASGYIKLYYKKGDVVAIGKVLASIFENLNDIKNANTSPLPKSSSQSQGVKTNISLPDTLFKFTRLSKKAQELIKDKNLDPKMFDGAGLVSARSLLEDSAVPQQTVPQQTPQLSIQPQEISPYPQLKSEKIDRNKKFEISALTAGQAGNINSSLTIQFNSEKVRATLKSLNVLNGQMLPLMLYELSHCLEAYPRFNSFYHQESVYFYDHINIGVAIDLGEGLKVGVIKDTNRLMPVDIYKTLTDYSMKYIKNKLTLEEVSGGTVTVTDLSGDDILFFQPLINQNQTIIFGFGGDSSLAGHPMSITGVFDHRVLSGRDVANFIIELKRRILTYESQNFKNLK